MSSVLLNPNDINQYHDENVVLLFSGGLDSVFAAYQLTLQGLRVHALYVDVGQTEEPDLDYLAKQLNITVKRVGARDKLCQNFIARGIQANALSNGQYPISSSYTRPLIASEGVRFAREIGSRLIAHSATPLQNSTPRFNLSILALANDIDIYCPSTLNYTPRERKAEILISNGILVASNESLYSIDENLWARVIESGPLEDARNEIQESVVFRGGELSDSEAQSCMITLEFHRGLPTAVNGKKGSLLAIVETLNEILSKYGIGRYSGHEDTLFGMKSHELREAPAASIIHQSHRLLEEMVLSADELRMKQIMDSEWTRNVITGGWFSPLKDALDCAIEFMNNDITGEIKWKVMKSSVFCISKWTTNSLTVSRHPEFYNEFQPYNFDSYYTQLARNRRCYINKSKED